MKTSPHPQISIVIPVYRSGTILPKLIEQLTLVLSQHFSAYEIILADDASPDDTWKVIESICVSNNQVKAVGLRMNAGQHNAIIAGLNYAAGEVIVCMDDDLQHPPEEIPKLIEAQKINNTDIVYGMYKVKYHSVIRNIGSAFIRKTSDYKKQTHEGGSSFRLLRKSLVETVVKNHSQNFLFLDAVLNWYSTNIQLVEVNHESRKFGKTGYTLTKLLNIYINIVYYYSTKPLKLIIILGLTSSFFSFLIGLRFIYNKLIHDVPLGYTSIIVAIMFSTSIILFCLGVIGNYLYKLYQLQQNKPPYSIKNVA